MFLPKILHNISKSRRKIGGFSGLNRTENYKEGQLCDSCGLSTENYPTLSQSKPFVKDNTYSGIVDMYEHNGKLLLVMDDGKLYFDGKLLGHVEPGKKQFATVNTKLCIFPDKVYVDLNVLELIPLAESLTSAHAPDSVDMGHNYITFAADPPIKKGLTDVFGDYTNDSYSNMICTYSYGTDRKAVAKCWDDENKTWINLRELQTESSLVGWSYSSVERLQEGAVIIPQITNDGKMHIVYYNSRSEAGVNFSDYNTQGRYCVITKVEASWDGEGELEYETVKYTYDAYSAGEKTFLFSGVFIEGDIVDVTGTPHGLYNGTKLQVKGINSEDNKLTFAADTFTGATSYLELTEDLSGEKIIKVQYYNSSNTDVLSAYYSVDIYDTVKAGKLLYSKNESFPFIYVWDKDKQATVGKYEAEQIWSVQNWNYEMEPYSFEGARVKVSKHIPDLDFVCESENRLWGVSNRTHTIYASALGMPGEFSDFDVISTDSYAVAVASENDFTAICAYGGGVCCFKENRLHKILGSYPAEYYMNEYEIAGVQEGSERSLCIINEVLYYKGEQGVYAYTGGTPRLISYELGNNMYNNAVANTDGRHYYVSLGSAQGCELFTYDTFHKLWMKEKELSVSAMANMDGIMTVLSQGILFMQSDDIKRAEWKAELAPFESDGIKRSYGKIIVRLDMEEGSSVQVLIREDGKRPKKICSRSALHEMSLELPLPIGRCNRFGIIFEGTGKVKLRSFTIEYLG